LTDSRPAEPALTRRRSSTPGAPAGEAPALTRAELRRRAQLETAAVAEAPRTRRQARVRVDAHGEASVAVEELPDLAPEALQIPDLPREVPLVVETAAAAVDASPTALPTGAIALPAAPVRRSRVRPAPAVDETLAMPAAPAEPALEVEVDDILEGVHRISAESVDAAHAATPDIDEFEAAAKLFSFTGETPVQVAAAAIREEEALEAAEPRRRGASFRRVATASFSVGVLGAVGLLTVGMTTPAEAVAAAQGTTPATVSVIAPGDVEDADAGIQAYVAPAQVQNLAVDRTEDYKTTTRAQMAADSGITNFSNFFTNNPDSAIQWPFAVGVPISYGFGMRSGRMHEGVDFTPGAGSPVQAIADGTVRIATESGGAYGVTVVLDHIIDGQLVSTRYGHMQYGSLQVKVGEQVKVGTVIGRTGNTGRSFGAHTHVEVLMNGTTPIDPLPWLREHAGG
jgi:murein DD-endopeptidase MepM/ murein hydrolase activator NlpD